MNKKNKIIISIIILILATALFLFITKAITNNTGHVVKNGDIEQFAKCLAQKNVKMYGTFWCGHCQNQKALFEGLLESSGIYVECDPRGENPQTELCLNKGIEGYPAWEIDGVLYYGEQSFERLSELSGCLLEF